MAYSFTNSKGVTYYLHTRRQMAASGKERVLFFFAKEIKEGAMDAVPAGYTVVEMKTGLGALLVIVECKRWAPPNKVGLAIVERFLHVIREKSKANFGIIAATTSFTLDARKAAREYEYQLKLADFELLREMAGKFGTWHQKRGCELWVPNYTSA